MPKNNKKRKIKNPIRTLSGVTPVAILTKSHPCPGKCIYCPTEENIPKSYLSSEPAVMRAVSCNFDPQKQITARIKTYKITNHPTDKIEIIIITSNWATLPSEYKQKFILDIYNCLNKLSNPNYQKTKNLNLAKKENETAKHRVVGMSIETRPDSITEKEIIKMRQFGITRVELGVQTIDEKILKLVKRGHGLKEIIKATKLLKDQGFKICYHLMPNLPGSSPKKDYQVIKKIFASQKFQPDQLKIYPCILTPNTQLAKWYKKGIWAPYDDKVMINLLAKIKSELIPCYVRIMRLWRDIPYQEITAGSKRSDMRLLVSEYLKKTNRSCSCIRCREIRKYPPEKNLTLDKITYQASFGKEIFLQYIDNRNLIYALVRLRLPKSPFIPILKNSAIIRELHVFGPSKSIENEQSNKDFIQHQGLGKKLIQSCENIVKKETSFKKLAVISAVGVRNYYRQLGYKLKEEYMVKKLA